MSRLLVCMMSIFLFVNTVSAADKTYSELAIAKAIKVLQTERDKTDDLLEKSRIDKAIRELEALVADSDAESKPQEASKLPALKFEVKPMLLKKKFGGKAVFNAKTGELALAYDFNTKGQLADFESKGKPVLSQKILMVDGGDKLTHVAKFNSVSASAILSLKSMRGIGISSTSRARFYSGGGQGERIFLNVPGGEEIFAQVPTDVRTGNIPVTFTVTQSQTSGRWADERIALDIANVLDTHQIILVAGTERCGFSNVVIVGVPEPVWFKQFLELE